MVTYQRFMIRQIYSRPKEKHCGTNDSGNRIQVEEDGGEENCKLTHSSTPFSSSNAYETLFPLVTIQRLNSFSDMGYSILRSPHCSSKLCILTEQCATTKILSLLTFLLFLLPSFFPILFFSRAHRIGHRTQI